MVSWGTLFFFYKTKTLEYQAFSPLISSIRHAASEMGHRTAHEEGILDRHEKRKLSIFHTNVIAEHQSLEREM